MRELANRCDSKIDEASIIQYVINGIDGPRSYKIILYGATSFSELKQKLRTYETIIKNMGIHNSKSPNVRHSYESRGCDFKQQSFQRKPTRFNVSDAAKNPQRCFNCNDIGHLSKSCPNHSRGPRCLSCNLYGHKSFECRRANLNNTSTPPSGVNAVHELPSPINMFKDVTIFGRKLNGLVDTGSNLTLLRISTYINIDALPLKQTNTLLTGFGFSRINVIGTFDSEITIDYQIFPVTISVVPNSCTNYDLIIGCDVIKQAHLNISHTGVKFAQILRPSDNANENFIMTISDGSPTFDIGPNVSQHNRAEVEQLLSTYTPKKTKTVNIELDIALTDDEPIFHKPRHLPFAERDIVDAQVDEWVKNGIIEPCSSPYASQVVVVKKKDGKSRVCIDYRRLNRKLIKDNYPLPLIDDILDCLQNSKIFTTLDLKNGFFHVAVNERSRKFTSFVTHNGQYQCRRMPFGLSTCPSTFMRYINAIFRHLISKSIVLSYMDDVVIPAANESQALEYLKIVLEVACDYGLEINFKKCQFLHNTIEFLGHIIENGRLFPSPSKTKAVINYPDLKNIKDVRRYLDSQWHRDLLVVPDEIQANIIKTAHERGHFAVLRTQDLVSKDFYIPRLKDKVEKCIQNCVTCILTNRKRGKQDGTLNSIEKNDLPLHIFHLDHLGPLATTSKKYKHVFAVIDAFSKFTRLYPTRSKDAAEVINRLENQRHVFGNLDRIISDKGSAFEDYCKKQNILHISITTGLPRSNGQIGKQNSTIIAVLSKLSVDDPEKWYSHVPPLQEILN
ncbi:retrovirus-related Pol polyprotein from transposon opus [Trichonephila clavipes]|nr:retrovirus-related Pol polyprotein from transposon opus [Trichonephila clavipes]